MKRHSLLLIPLALLMSPAAMAADLDGPVYRERRTTVIEHPPIVERRIIEHHHYYEPAPRTVYVDEDYYEPACIRLLRPALADTMAPASSALSAPSLAWP